MIVFALAAMFVALHTTSAYAENMYVGFKLGKVKHTISDVENTPTAMGLLGGYAINTELAIEFEYIDLGYYGASRGNAADVGLLYFYPGDKPLSLYVKLSYAATTWKAANQTQYNSAFTHSLGLQYDTSPTLGYRIGLDRHLLGNQPAISIDALSATAIYRF